MLRTGRVLTGLLAAFLLFDGGARLAGFAPYVEGTVQFGYPESHAPWIGITLIASTVLYLVPRTAVLGAVLLTGYLGGATAGHVRLGMPFVFPVVFGVLVWGALWLLDPRLRALVSPRR
ncbi:MAG TPA: DoxX family protein [Longimicrobiaceae bacterium]|nr:DoxX family protein [Longimicrobiaceae bacterium]